MKAIWKYKVRVGTFPLDMPSNAKILSVQVQKQKDGRSTPCLWAIVDTENNDEMRWFYLVGTGHLFEATEENVKQYIGTFQLDDGKFVGHLFEVK